VSRCVFLAGFLFIQLCDVKTIRYSTLDESYHKVSQVVDVVVVVVIVTLGQTTQID